MPRSKSTMFRNRTRTKMSPLRALYVESITQIPSSPVAVITFAPHVLSNALPRHQSVLPVVQPPVAFSTEQTKSSKRSIKRDKKKRKKVMRMTTLVRPSRSRGWITMDSYLSPHPVSRSASRESIYRVDCMIRCPNSLVSRTLTCEGIR